MNSSRDVLKRRHSNNNSQDFKDPKKRVQAYKCTSIFCKMHLFRNTSINPFVLLWNMDKLKWKTGSDTTIISSNVSFVGSFVISIICILSYLPHRFIKLLSIQLLQMIKRILFNANSYKTIASCARYRTVKMGK